MIPKRHAVACAAAIFACLISSPSWAAGAHTGLEWHQTAADVSATCDQAIAETKARIARIEALPATRWTFSDAMLQIENAEADLNDETTAQTFLSQVAPDKAVRDAGTQCQQVIGDYFTQLGSDPALYAVAARVQASGTAVADADRKLVASYLLTGKRSGAALSKADRATVTALFSRLNRLQIGFGQALAEDKTTIHVTKAQAASLTASFVAANCKPSGDGYDVPVNESTYSQFMYNERDEAAREAFYIANAKRGGQANVSRLEQAVKIRYQIAQLFGYRQWADYQLAAKMAGTPDRVISFLSEIEVQLLPKARAEHAELAALKRADVGPAPFRNWDVAYYENKLLKTRFAVDQEAVRQYFPVDRVISGVFDIYQRLLGVRFAEIAQPDAWAPDVREFSIADAALGRQIGWFYLDLYPREGKYDHFADFGVRPGRVRPDGSYQKPVTVIVGNWPTAEPGKPALLSHGDVVTFFHEFGHAMHSTLSTAPYETLYGTAVRGDFVEAPSQMLENWMWQPSILRQISSNVVTGKPLPDALIAKMVALRHATDGLDFTGQAFYAAYDMTLHASGPTVDATKLWAKLDNKLTTNTYVPGTYGEASFGHLMGGYDAGYYGYLWSLVFAQDMFTVFQRDGLESPVAGMRYRKDILEPGAVYEPDVLLRNFLGRPVSYTAFYEYLGIKHP